MIRRIPLRDGYRAAPLRAQRPGRATRSQRLHASHCICGACRNPAEARPSHRAPSISLIFLIGLAASTGLLFLADATTDGPGLQVMIGQPGKHP